MFDAITDTIFCYQKFLFLFYKTHVWDDVFILKNMGLVSAIC